MLRYRVTPPKSHQMTEELLRQPVIEIPLFNFFIPLYNFIFLSILFIFTSNNHG
jgi:hypothetical protein